MCVCNRVECLFKIDFFLLYNTVWIYVCTYIYIIYIYKHFVYIFIYKTYLFLTKVQSLTNSCVCYAGMRTGLNRSVVMPWSMKILITVWCVNWKKRWDVWRTSSMPRAWVTSLRVRPFAFFSALTPPSFHYKYFIRLLMWLIDCYFFLVLKHILLQMFYCSVPNPSKLPIKQHFKAPQMAKAVQKNRQLNLSRLLSKIFNWVSVQSITFAPHEVDVNISCFQNHLLYNTLGSTFGFKPTLPPLQK